MPWWWTVINSILFCVVFPFIIGFVMRLHSVRSRNLHMHRIPSTKELAAQAMKSALTKNSTLETAMPFADVALVLLLTENNVAMLSKEARAHVLNSAYFDIHNG